MRQVLARLAAGAPVPIFPVAGDGGRQAARHLHLAKTLEVVDSPRHAGVLVVVGRLPRALYGPALAVHDQLAPPRLSVVWDDDSCPVFPHATRVHSGAELADAIAEVHRDVLAGRRQGEPHALPDMDLVAWRGVGPYGHGGKGMTGGTPHGRPLAERSPDRDGLYLDQLSFGVGPFFPAFPPGLVLHLKLQGDVIQEVELGDNPYLRRPVDPGPAHQGDPFHRALSEPVPLAEVELARARHHLAWLADALRVQGLAALGRRALHLADGLTVQDGPRLERLVSLVGRSQVLRWSVAGPGRLERELVASRGLGPVARAAGAAEDARQLDPAYAQLGFEPVVHEAGDSSARWRQRLAETAQSLELARRAGDKPTTVMDLVESPRGPISIGSATASSHLLDLLPELLAGLEWGDAVATVMSLDLDMEEAAKLSEPVAMTEAGR